MRNIGVFAVIILAMAWFVGGGGCSSPTAAYQHTVTGASASGSNVVEKNGAAQSRTTEVTITPATRPAGMVETETAVFAAASQPASRLTIDGTDVSVPFGAGIIFKRTETGTPDRYIHTRNVQATGANLRTNVKEGAGSFDASAPKIGMGKGEDGGLTADAGDVESSWKWLGQALSATSKGALILYVLGGLLIVAGVVMGWFRKSFFDALALGLGGLALIGTGVVIDKYPWVVLLTVAVCVAIGVGYWLYVRKTKALQAVTGAVEASPPTVSDTVKGIMRKIATPAIKAEVSKAKRDTPVVNVGVSDPTP